VQQIKMPGGTDRYKLGDALYQSQYQNMLKTHGGEANLPLAKHQALICADYYCSKTSLRLG
jgi:hypothetical protein